MASINFFLLVAYAACISAEVLMDLDSRQYSFTQAWSSNHTNQSEKRFCLVHPELATGYDKTTQSFKFNATSKPIVCNLDISPNKYPKLSIEVWFKLDLDHDHGATNAWILGHDNSGYDRSIIVSDRRYGGMGAGMGYATNFGLGYAPKNVWIHTVVSYDQGVRGGSFMMVNGKKSRMLQARNNPGLNRFTIGGLEKYSRHHLVGNVMRVRIVNEALKEDEIAERYSEFDREYCLYADCPSQKYRIGKSCRGSAADRYQCVECSQCGDNEYQAARCSKTADTVCLPQPTCGQGERLIGATSTSKGSCMPCPDSTFRSDISHRETTCIPWSPCFGDEHETIAPNASANRVCATSTVCNDLQFESKQKTDTSDRECTGLSVCVAGQYVLTEHTPTTDRKCEDCGESEFQMNENQASCESKSYCGIGMQVSDKGTKTEDLVCSDCEELTFQNKSQHRSEYCMEQPTCGQGEYSLPFDKSHAMQCQQCPDGEYQNEELHRISFCLPYTVLDCPPDTYLANPGDKTTDQICLPCPSGQHLPAEGHTRSECQDTTTTTSSTVTSVTDSTVTDTTVTDTTVSDTSVTDTTFSEIDDIVKNTPGTQSVRTDENIGKGKPSSTVTSKSDGSQDGEFSGSKGDEDEKQKVAVTAAVTVVVIVVLLILVILAVLYAKRKSKGSSENVVAFDNPMYDTTQGSKGALSFSSFEAGMENDNYQDILPANGAAYMDVAPNETAGTTGYMDVAPNATGGNTTGYMDIAPNHGGAGHTGYMDVSPSNDDFDDDSEEEV
eukprot:m.13045 g.13045  ORF g.13045 m.13045 type:complete len:781 (-) comp4778_c0_seq1:109-2451(-)